MDKFIYYPYKPFIINQYFGESGVCVPDTPNVPLAQRPIIGKKYNQTTCPVGYVELYPLLGMKGHTGLDLYAVRGAQTLKAGIKGVVVEISYDNARGLGVGILSPEKFNLGEHGTHYVKLRQWHLHSLAVKLGQVVEPWTDIGVPDSTGMSSGDHCHLELKPVEIALDANNPDTLLKNVYQDNGYFGSIDPTPYFIGQYPKAPTSVGGIFEKLLNKIK